ncbi:MAG: ABC transporter ATP-binding protein [Burkholderiales bacterium]|nr:ABC transporter ATP-binding protein [Burkholderiales bacterium]
MSIDAKLVGARDVHVHYGEAHVLRGVSLTIRAGEAIGLLGRNGMGKSTLIRTLMGHLRASRGRIEIRGQDGARMRPDRVARSGIAYVPEGRAIFGNLSVRENLMVAARPGTGGRDDWPLPRILDTFPRLGERLDHGGQQLSGGEQQMLAIGRALSTNPDVLILDEATEGLAPRIVQEIWRIIGTIRATGIASLIVDRNFRTVLANTDRVVVLEKGLVVLEDRSAALAAQPVELARRLGV